MDGKSLVICGGLRGKRWCLSTMFLGAENFPFFEIYFRAFDFSG
jgi:hypothetical protein